MSRLNRQTRRLLPLTSGALLVAAAVLAPSCRTNSPDTPTAAERARQAGQRRVRNSHRTALGESESRDLYELSVRFNPPRCPAPPFEVYARGRWDRVFISTSGSLREKLADFRERARDESPLSTLRVLGKLAGRRRAENGQKYRVFRVKALPGE